MYVSGTGFRECADIYQVGSCVYYGVQIMCYGLVFIFVAGKTSLPDYVLMMLCSSVTPVSSTPLVAKPLQLLRPTVFFYEKNAHVTYSTYS